jgi:cold shock CspA family protein
MATDGRYGFIECPKYDSVFFHYSEVREGVDEKSLIEGEIVLFDPFPSPKLEEKWKAEDVSLISSTEEHIQVSQCYFEYYLDPYIQDKFPLFLKGLFAHAKRHLQMVRQENASKELYEHFRSSILLALRLEKNNSKYTFSKILENGLTFFPDYDETTFSLIQNKVTPDLHYTFWWEKKTYVFPIAYLLDQKIIFNQRGIQNIAPRTSVDQLVELYTLQIEEYLGKDQADLLNEIKRTIESAKKNIPSHLKNFMESIDHQLTSIIKFALWDDQLFDSCPSEVIIENWKLGDFAFSEKALKRVNTDQKKELAELFQQSMTIHYKGHDNTYLLFKEFYSQVSKLVSAEVQIDLVRKNRSFFDGFDQIQLWIDKFDDTCPVEVILIEIGTLEKQYVENIFSVANLEETHLILKGLVFIRWEKISDSEQLQILRIANNKLSSKELELDHKIKERTFQISTASINIQLWLEDFHDFFDFEVYKSFVITLPSESQKIFLKKVFYYIHSGRISLSIEELTNLNVIDYGLSQELEKIDGQGVDYSISIILNFIRDFYQQEILKDNFESKKRIVEIIVSQLRDPKDILEISGFFDKCEGRAITRRVQEKDKESVVFSIYRNETDIPRNHTICDGRIAMTKGSANYALDEASGLKFWWCANQKCFDPCRKLKTEKDWRSYSIQDFLHILKIPYNETDLEIYLSLINKVNRFLEHLKCRNCDHILRPIKQSNYAFYGVNHFHCTNESCQENGKEIYLTHCLNGRCDSTIDSRDSVKCTPEGYDQGSCGWYICNECHACCSSEKLLDRKRVIESYYKSDYKCQIVGHRDLGIICCNECGSEMETFAPKVEEYNKYLEWFIKNREKSAQIVKSGQNKFGKWWFRLRAKDGDLSGFHKRIIQYKKVGFQAPEYEEGNEYQLISEPINLIEKKTNQLHCVNCGNQIDLNEFPEKRQIMKGYHEKINL